MGSDTDVLSTIGKGIAESITTTVPVKVPVCNIHVTPAPDQVIGTVGYYYRGIDFSRYKDFNSRHIGCKHTVPDYYKDYGDKYIKRFTEELYPKLSKAGQEWLVKARKLLQIYMEDGFVQNLTSTQVTTQSIDHPRAKSTINTPTTESLELDQDRFRSFAYGTHLAAYIDGGLANLTFCDLGRVGSTPDWKDLFSRDGRKQILEITYYLAITKAANVWNAIKWY